MPPRTRRSVLSVPMPQRADENSDPMRNTMHMRGSGQQQVTPVVGTAAASARPALSRKLPVLFET